ncbi:hypothetical protein PLEI_1448 [Photobacterium leiognathi lrivu.4.1]|uniref:Uncharacterized protein n=1 Tax=Photobacterium leiognathi lrivu.4.1 TaxID=1248232 RepID=A0A0U1P5R6_PHOLE|nr:hypothetical protein [Photobacterium leiognathi]GAD29795.1 hypothetical protein PLEI_1448 [Photobacterium leiognathi lrivu.4.1]
MNLADLLRKQTKTRVGRGRPTTLHSVHESPDQYYFPDASATMVNIIDCDVILKCDHTLINNALNATVAVNGNGRDRRPLGLITDHIQSDWWEVYDKLREPLVGKFSWNGIPVNPDRDLPELQHAFHEFMGDKWDHHTRLIEMLRDLGMSIYHYTTTDPQIAEAYLDICDDVFLVSDGNKAISLKQRKKHEAEKKAAKLEEERNKSLQRKPLPVEIVYVTRNTMRGRELVREYYEVTNSASLQIPTGWSVCQTELPNDILKNIKVQRPN